MSRISFVAYLFSLLLFIPVGFAGELKCELCDLRYKDYRGMDLSSSVLKGAYLFGADFSRANLNNSQLNPFPPPTSINVLFGLHIFPHISLTFNRNDSGGIQLPSFTYNSMRIKEGLVDGNQYL